MFHPCRISIPTLRTTLLFVLLSASILRQASGQTANPSTNNSGGQSKPGAGNPLLKSQANGETKALPLPGSDTLRDFRNTVDPRRSDGAGPTKGMPLFGYSFFEPARLAIEARRNYLRSVLSGERTSAALRRKDGAQENGDVSNTLTEAQKLDLLMRQRDGTLTEEEKQRYSEFLNPPDRVQEAFTREEQDAVNALTDTQKLDLLTRQREGTLTEEEKRRFRALLVPQPNRRAAVTASPEEMEAIKSLTDAQKLDLLNRQRAGKLTEEEKRRYNAFLTRTQPAAGAVTGRTNGDSKQADTPREDVGPGHNQPLPPIDAFREVADPIQQLYRNVNASIPVNYQLSAGDSITLRYWNRAIETRERTLVVDAQGGITLPEIGRVIVRGQTAVQAEAALRERLSHFYRDVQVSLSLKELRTITVTLSGEAFSPGDYTVPAVVSALNLLTATGGPTEDGTLRRIEIRRRGALIGVVDFYKFMITGDATTDITLQPGDVIFIPGRFARVAVRGEVRRPAVYEMVEGETLKDVLRYAGGVNPSGVQQHVSVQTVQPGSARIVKDVDVTALQTAPPMPVYDGDLVEVFSLRPEVVNQVTISGAVDQPGDYAISPGMTVADLVQRARGLTSDAFPTLAHLFRWNPDNTRTLVPVNLEKALARDPAFNLPLTRWDQLTVYRRQDIAFTGRREVRVRGAVVKEGIFERSDNMRVKDLLVLAGGTTPEAYIERAVLLHQGADGTNRYDIINLAGALAGNAGDNVLLEDRDVLAVYRSDEARFTPEHTVRIEGAVTSPGTYPRGEQMRLSTLLDIAGGLRPSSGDQIVIAHARADRSDLPVKVTYSASTARPTPDPLLQDGDVVTIQRRGGFQERPGVVVVSGAVNAPGPVVLRQNMRFSDVLKEAGGLRPEAYPEGLEFYRDPARLTASHQNQIADIINRLNDLLNNSEYNRELAKSDLERIKALNSATKSQIPLALPGLSATPDIAGGAAAATGAARLFQREIVSQPRNLSASDLLPHGNVAVDVASALKKPGGQDDLIMQDGDSVSIPEKPTTIQVIGAVLYPRGVQYREGARLDYYLEQTGGYTADAAKERVVVIRLGGGLMPIKGVKSLRPGDVILIPTKVLAARLTSKSSEIDSIFRGLTTSAVIVLVAKKLFGL